MRFIEGLGVVILVVLAAVVLFGGRRILLGRGGGTVEVSMRLRERTHGRGWALGVGRYVGDQLQWFRAFSLSPRPRATFHRRDLVVERRRQPKGTETLALQAASIVLECRSRAGVVQLAMSESALPGFLSWLEAGPPGAPSPRWLV